MQEQQLLNKYVSLDSCVKYLGAIPVLAQTNSRDYLQEQSLRDQGFTVVFDNSHLNSFLVSHSEVIPKLEQSQSRPEIQTKVSKLEERVEQEVPQINHTRLYSSQSSMSYSHNYPSLQQPAYGVQSRPTHHNLERAVLSAVHFGCEYMNPHQKMSQLYYAARRKI